LAVLRAIPEEADGAVAKVQEHASTIALLDPACLIVAFLAVDIEGSIQRTHEPAIGAVSTKVASGWIKARPADADQGV
jgi:hypothetical protein